MDGAETQDSNSLAEMLSNGRRIRGPLWWFIAEELTAVVREIHTAGFVHGELTPANILVGPEGIEVLDFAGDDDGSPVPPVEATVGSDVWLSPEQIMGAPVDTRTDIFNIGAVLAFIALARHPFGNSVPGATSSGTGSGSRAFPPVMHGDPPGSESVEVMKSRIAYGKPNIAELPDQMRVVVERCLSTRPSERPTLEDLGTYFRSGGDSALPVRSAVADPTPPSSMLPPLPPVPAQPTPSRGLEMPAGRGDREAIRNDRPAGRATAFPQIIPPVIASPEPSRRTARRTEGRGSVSLQETFEDPNRTGEIPMIRRTTSSVTPPLGTSRPRRRGAIAAVVVGVLGVVAVVGIIDGTNVVDLGVIGPAGTDQEGRSADGGETPTMSSDPTATADASSTAPPTTVPATTVPPTTLPPVPVYRHYQVDGNKYRWNPCQNPIEILLNPSGKLTPTQQSTVEAFLGQQAAELSTLTGMTIEYAGLTEDKSGSGYTYGEKILLHFDVPGQGVLVDDKPFQGTISGDRIKDGYREIDAVQLQYNSNALDYMFTGDEFRPYGQWLLMVMLGNALGLDALSDADMTAAGSTQAENWSREVMYFGGQHSETPTWGPGDAQGFAAVGASVGCF